MCRAFHHKTDLSRRSEGCLSWYFHVACLLSTLMFKPRFCRPYVVPCQSRSNWVGTDPSPQAANQPDITTNIIRICSLSRKNDKTPRIQALKQASYCWNKPKKNTVFKASYNLARIDSQALQTPADMPAGQRRNILDPRLTLPFI